MDGQHDLERGAFAHFALHADAAVVALNDAMRDRQTQTRPNPDSFGGEERVKNIFQVIGRNATARVRHRQIHKLLLTQELLR